MRNEGNITLSAIFSAVGFPTSPNEVPSATQSFNIKHYYRFNLGSNDARKPNGPINLNLRILQSFLR
ncbi:MAG: hypothetical protein ACTS44_00425 [Candidatus Hodgkinia cicadicola]